MYMKTICTLSVAALGFALWTANAKWQIFLRLVISAGAALATLHALRAKPKYFWAAAFSGLVVLLNPIWPIAFPYRVFLPLDLMGMWLFVFYVALRQTKPKLAMASV